MERIEIDLDGHGLGTVKIGEEDVSDYVSSLELTAEAANYTRLTIHFLKMPVVIKTFGEVIFTSK